MLSVEYHHHHHHHHWNKNKTKQTNRQMYGYLELFCIGLSLIWQDLYPFGALNLMHSHINECL